MRNLFLFVALCVSLDVSASPLYKQCIEYKAMISKRPSLDVTWSDYHPRKDSLAPVLRVDKFQIPVLTDVTHEATILGTISHPKLAFMPTIEEFFGLAQFVKIDNQLSQSLPYDHPELQYITAFEALEKSFSVASNSINCNQLDGDAPEAVNNSVNLILLLLKANFVPYDSIDVIKTKKVNSFLIRTKNGFEYHELRGGRNLSVTVFGAEDGDVNRFLNSVDNENAKIEKFEIASKILQSIESRSIYDWNDVIELMEKSSYRDSALKLVMEHIEYLTNQ